MNAAQFARRASLHSSERGEESPEDLRIAAEASEMLLASGRAAAQEFILQELRGLYREMYGRDDVLDSNMFLVDAVTIGRAAFLEASKRGPIPN